MSGPEDQYDELEECHRALLKIRLALGLHRDSNDNLVDVAKAMRERLEQLAKERDALQADARRWGALCELWFASTEFQGTQDVDGLWSLTMVEPVEFAWEPSRWTGDTPDDAIDPLVKALAEAQAREDAHRVALAAKG